MFVRAPTLAWMLTALACFLAGMAVDEGWRQAGALPAHPSAGVVVTYEVVYLGIATVAPTPRPTASAAPSPTPCDPSGPASPRFGCTGNAR